MTQTFVQGKMEELVSKIEFSLNFEDKGGSVKVKVGDTVLYDGVQAKFTKVTGEEVTGKSTSLRSAVARNWLSLKSDNTETTVDMAPVKVSDDGVVYKKGDYDPLKGGDFDNFIQDETNTPKAKTEIIQDEEQVVKRTSYTSDEEDNDAQKVVRDQEEIKGVSSITSSTSGQSKKASNKMTTVRSGDGHAEHVIVKKKASVQSDAKKNKSFTVDNTTPKVPAEATLNELTKATSDKVQFNDSQDGVIIKKASNKKGLILDRNESQDAQVVGKVGSPGKRMADEPAEVEGIVFKKTKENTVKGSTPVADLTGIKTQSEVDEIEQEISPKTASKDFINMLPEGWSKLHWVKKEKFVLALNDIDFVKYIQTVESTKALQKACKKRLMELEK